MTQGGFPGRKEFLLLIFNWSIAALHVVLVSTVKQLESAICKHMPLPS